MAGGTKETEGQIPHAIEAEKEILATILYAPAHFDRVALHLGVDDFFSTANREIFSAMRELSSVGEVISRTSVADTLTRKGRLEIAGGRTYLAELIEFPRSEAALDYTVSSVKARAMQRKLVELAQNLVHKGLSPQADVDDLLQQAEKGVYHLVEERPVDNAVPLERVVTQLMHDIRERMQSEQPVLGIPTNFSDFDEITSGLHKGNLIIIAARPSMGKTALALNIACSVGLRTKSTVVLFSLEMSREELALRLLASESGIDAKRLREGRLAGGETQTFIDAVRRLSGARIIVDDTPAVSIFEIRSRTRRLVREGKCDLVIVDYLQQVRGSGKTDSREQEIAEVSRMLKAIARELKVPVVALSQLNRQLESRKDKRPLLSDLRESGAIEQDADVIAFIYRDEYYEKNSKDKGVAEIIIGKQRNGPVGTVRLGFQPNLTRFVNLSRTMDDFVPTFPT